MRSEAEDAEAARTADCVGRGLKKLQADGLHRQLSASLSILVPWVDHPASLSSSMPYGKGFIIVMRYEDEGVSEGQWKSGWSAVALSMLQPRLTYPRLSLPPTPRPQIDRIVGARLRTQCDVRNEFVGWGGTIGVRGRGLRHARHAASRVSDITRCRPTRRPCPQQWHTGKGLSL
jgi:hypothetical protein